MRALISMSGFIFCIDSVQEPKYLNSLAFCKIFPSIVNKIGIAWLLLSIVFFFSNIMYWFSCRTMNMLCVPDRRYFEALNRCQPTIVYHHEFSVYVNPVRDIFLCCFKQFLWLDIKQEMRQYPALHLCIIIHTDF